MELDYRGKTCCIAIERGIILKRIFSAILTVFILCTFLTISPLASREVSITSPAGDCTTDLEKFAVECEGAEKIIFELDGNVIGETDGEEELPIDEGILTAGNHTLVAKAVFADKSAAVASVDFMARKKILNMSAKQDFNDYVQGNEAGQRLVVYYQPGKHGSGNACEVYPVPGPSGEDGDYAFNMRTLFDYMSGNAPYIVYNGFNNFGARGEVAFEFDLKVDDSSTAEILLNNIMLPEKTMWLLYRGVFGGTDHAVPDGWMHIKIVNNFVTNKTRLEINNEEIYNGDMTLPYTACSNFDIRLYQGGRRTEETRAEMALDNFDFKQELLYGFSKISYEDADGNSFDYTGTLPHSVAKINLGMTEALSASSVKSENVTLASNGVKIDAEVSYDAESKSVIVTPSKAIPKGETVTVTLNENIKFADGTEAGDAVVATMESEDAELIPLSIDFKINGNLLLSSAQLQNGDVISADVTLNNDSETVKDMTVILFVRQNKKLRAISAVETLGIAPGETPSVNVTLPALSGLDSEGTAEIKLSVCDTLGNALPYMSYTQIK